MISIKFQVVLILLTSGGQLIAQEVPGKVKDSIRPEESVFTIEEQQYMQKWFSEVITELDLNEESKAKYSKLLREYGKRMSGLTTSKRATISDEQLKQDFVEIIDEMNLEVKTFLSEDQYKIHYKVFDLLKWNVFLRKGWKRD